MNLEDKVLQLINKQIDDDVEFRTVLPTSKAIAKIMASFANTNGGFLIVGVKSTGRNEVVGLSSDFYISNIVYKSIELLEPNVERFSFEQLIDLDPDVIFIVITEQHYGDERMYLDRIYQNKALQGLKAVKNKRIYPVPLYAIYSPGIRAYDGIRIMAQGLYPELYKEK